jgi:hypothetical protein
VFCFFLANVIIMIVFLDAGFFYGPVLLILVVACVGWVARCGLLFGVRCGTTGLIRICYYIGIRCRSGNVPHSECEEYC